jgi:hypothetical protein
LMREEIGLTGSVLGTLLKRRPRLSPARMRMANII